MKRSPEERRSLQGARRWKRRARIAAPFLSLPPLVAVLMFSVDLVECRPVEPRERLVDRPIMRLAPSAQRSNRSPIVSVSSVPVTSTPSVAITRAPRAEALEATSPTSLALELDRPAPEALRPPTSPEGLRRSR
jgi:hypothetical protein